MIPANLDRDEMALELIRRSYTNWKDYRREYEITHLLNSLLCLLILPKETFYTAKSTAVSNDAINEDLLSRLRSGIEEDSAAKDKLQVRLNEIIRRIRNAICHGDIELIGEYPPSELDKVMVHAIKFEDNYKGENFTIKVSTENLGQLVEELYRCFLEHHK